MYSMWTHVYNLIMSVFSRKSNELDHRFEIKSQSQVEPPSPSPLQSSIASPPLMFLDTDLKYQGHSTIDFRGLPLKTYRAVIYPGGVCVC